MPRAKGNERTEESNAQGPPKKVRKFNPFWRARGKPFHNPFAKSEKPVSVQLPFSNIEELDEDEITEEEQNVQNLPIDKLGNADHLYWTLYFPKIEYKPDCEPIEYVKAFQLFFYKNLNIHWPDLEDLDVERTIDLRYSMLLEDEEFQSKIKDFPKKIKTQTEVILTSAGLVVHEMIHRILKDKANRSYLETFQVHLLDYKPVLNLTKCLTLLNHDNLISIRGTVMRVHDAKLLDYWQVYRCNVCRNQQIIRQVNGKKTLPMSCKKGCRVTSHFNDVLDSPYRVYQPFQVIRIQESIYASDVSSSNGGIPQSIDAIVKYDLVDRVTVGEDIILTGILRVDSKYQKRNNESAREYFQTVNITTVNQSFTVQRIAFRNNDVQAINQIKKQPSVFRFLVNSLAPDIYGEEMVKAGLLLSLFGGAKEPNSSFREAIHVLMVGDPGMGKSVLLNACCKVAPKAIYSISSHLSGPGLTAGIKRVNNRIAVEGGVLVLADSGICCIDELDKKPNLHIDLLDAMERQKISIIKIGTRVNLSANTTIIAAANPFGNVYNKQKTVTENLKMNPALVSRFDLIFIMVKNNITNYATRIIQKGSPGTSNANNSLSESFVNLEQSLRLRPGERIDPLPSLLFQNYIGYAKNNCFPKLSRSAKLKIEDFYKSLKKLQNREDWVAVTTRQLQALRRLCIARARIDLSDEVTEVHVNEIIEITRYSMLSLFLNETGELDLTRGMQGSGMSKRSQKVTFYQCLCNRYEKTGQDTFSMEEMKTVWHNLNRNSSSSNDIFTTIDSLNAQGLLLMRGSGKYKVCR